MQTIINIFDKIIWASIGAMAATFVWLTYMNMHGICINGSCLLVVGHP